MVVNIVCGVYLHIWGRFFADGKGKLLWQLLLVEDHITIFTSRIVNLQMCLFKEAFKNLENLTSKQHLKQVMLYITSITSPSGDT